MLALLTIAKNQIPYVHHPKDQLHGFVRLFAFTLSPSVQAALIELLAAFAVRLPELGVVVEIIKRMTASIGKEADASTRLLAMQEVNQTRIHTVLLIVTIY